jgi:hypothetical protein
MAAASSSRLRASRLSVVAARLAFCVRSPLHVCSLLLVIAPRSWVSSTLRVDDKPPMRRIFFFRSLASISLRSFDAHLDAP